MVNMIIRDVPDDLHRRFKVLCAEEGEPMKGKVIQIIREYVEKQEKKKAKK